MGRQAHAALRRIGFNTHYSISDIGRCRKFGYASFYYGTYSPAYTVSHHKNLDVHGMTLHYDHAVHYFTVLND